MVRVVELVKWEHQCCGPAYERNEFVQLQVRPRAGLPSVAIQHDLGSTPLTPVGGRVANLHIQHADGTTEEILRIPSGRSLCGFDEIDDGLLERPWDQQPVVNDSDTFLITLTVSSP